MIRGRRMLLAVLGMAVAIASHAGAQEISKDLNLVGLTLSLGETWTTYSPPKTPRGPRFSDDWSSRAAVGLFYERLITNKLSLGGGGTYLRVSGESFGEVSGATTYYWNPANGGSPYASVQCALFFGSEAEPVSFSGHLGYLMLLGPKERGIGLSVEVAGIHYVHDYGTSNVIAVRAGFTFYFRSKRALTQEQERGTT